MFLFAAADRRPLGVKFYSDPPTFFSPVVPISYTAQVYETSGQASERGSIMDSKTSGGNHTRSSTKTLYTPIFYATPHPSGSSSIPRDTIPAVYLDCLSRKHIALAQIVQEVPSSRCGSPFDGEAEEEDSESKTRVEALSRRVKQAFEFAKGDTADGKWTLLVQLLRLTSTRGGPRWVGSTTEGKKADSTSGWVNARTETEWRDWEKKWKEDHALKQKVEIWKQNIHAGPSVSLRSLPETLVESKSKSTVTGPSNEHVKIISVIPKTNGSRGRLGFPVMKRSSLTTIGKPPKPGATAGLSKDISVPSPRFSNAAMRLDANLPIDSSSSPLKPQGRAITDISETSFLPPSFPSELMTSTPNEKMKRRQKPSPIPLVPSSQPLSSPPSVRIYGSQRSMVESSSSLSQLPSTPTRYPRIDSLPSEIQHREKRARSLTPDHAQKKARTVLSPPSSTEPILSSIPHPLPAAQHKTPTTTPKRAQLPTLTELLASAKKAKASPKGKGKTVNHAIPVDKSQQKEPMISEEPEIRGSHASNVFAVVDSYAETSSYAMGLGFGEGLDYDITSPAKSLSSLAASDSDEDEEDHGGNGMGVHYSDGFNPPFTSTQAGDGLAKAGSGFAWTGYNYQFDVNGKVDMVSKFMEKDVDYDGWLKDPSLEPEDVESQ